ncbi:hypothetical protein MRX96_053542 [Rhipicephalus microplus]
MKGIHMCCSHDCAGSSAGLDEGVHPGNRAFGGGGERVAYSEEHHRHGATQQGAAEDVPGSPNRNRPAVFAIRHEVLSRMLRLLSTRRRRRLPCERLFAGLFRFTRVRLFIQLRLVRFQLRRVFGLHRRLLSVGMCFSSLRW